MKILVIGANGKIGTHLCKKLRDHEAFIPVAMIRKEEQKEKFSGDGIETVTGDLEDSVKNLSGLCTGFDAIVFTAGSGGKTGADKTLLIDLDGAVKSMEAAKAAGVQRYVMVSALQAHNRENWNTSIKHYYAAKHYADKELMRSGLDYTILRPGRLTDEPGTGKVSLSKNLPERGSIPREDVASVIVEVLSNKNTIGKDLDLLSGGGLKISDL